MASLELSLRVKCDNVQRGRNRDEEPMPAVRLAPPAMNSVSSLEPALLDAKPIPKF